VTGILIRDKFDSLQEVDFDALSNNLVQVLPRKHDLYKKQIASALNDFFSSGDTTLTGKSAQAVIPNSMNLRQFVYLRNGI
jgi:hypothetical protein